VLLGLLLATAIHLPPIAAFAAGADATDAEKRVFQQAMQAAAAKNYARAKRNLAALVARKPAHPLYRFNYGNILYLETDSAGPARQYLPVAKSKSPLALPARLYLAKSLGKLGKPGRAWAILRQAPLAGAPPALRAE